MKKRMRLVGDAQRWPESRWRVPPRKEFMNRGIFLSPLNTPISPSRSPHARAAAELAADSRSICTTHAGGRETQEHCTPVHSFKK